VRRVLILGLLLSSCGADPEVTREYYPVFQEDREGTQECPEQLTCDEVVRRVVQRLRLNLHKTDMALEVCQ
jgi:hypothetical protein